MTDQFLQTAFHINEDIFKNAREFEFAPIDLGFNLIEAFADGGSNGLGDNALASQHGSMGLGARDVLGIQAPIKIN
mgnify:CR=1 FL=1